MNNNVAQHQSRALPPRSIKEPPPRQYSVTELLAPAVCAAQASLNADRRFPGLGGRRERGSQLDRISESQRSRPERQYAFGEWATDFMLGTCATQSDLLDWGGGAPCIRPKERGPILALRLPFRHMGPGRSDRQTEAKARNATS
ncbi:hypothetical protein AAFF_G00339560 [Aldrovandia affinis]|uniref:Uncharacterized protein n=1 Tax=Aldrovandia affinis TaxID=143900 RepID=A0AAD7SKH8_9TELE|nr:hypothetical protein AAFF_G00339560 [Aldrovandia affinis]